MWNYRQGLDQLPTYSVEDKDWDIKLDANENPINLPPLVHERVINRLSFLPFNRYPEMSMLSLREQIASDYNLSVDNILIGSGSSEILLALCHALGGAGHSIVYPTPSFSMYGIYVKMADGLPIPVELEQDYTVNRDKVLQAAEEANTSLIMLCNPNNPTGTIMPAEDIEYIVSRATCPVAVDEAYYEFYGQSAVNLLNKYPNLIVTRTFSKAYGLASARVGYMLASAELTAAVGKVMMPYHVNALSLATAEVVYQMRDEFQGVISQTVAERSRMATALKNLTDVYVYPSEANFLLIKVDKAKEVAAHLAEKQISIRDFSSTPGLTDCLRVTIGTPIENDAFIKAVKQFLERG